VSQPETRTSAANTSVSISPLTESLGYRDTPCRST